MKNFDFITILFSSVIYFILYICWHQNFLFGKIYKKLESKKIDTKNKYLKYLFLFITIYVFVFFFAVFEVILSVTSFWDGVFFGFIIWLAFIMPHNLFLVIFKKRTFKLFLLDNTLYLLSIILIGAILAG
ncbi:MAG: hypothetical protein K1060chlam5_00293 [Candidatus Anoxychlamydiales bacterium]|nr:hypothetical protein [Candidatus Anoxychlamydiales bacterium]